MSKKILLLALVLTFVSIAHAESSKLSTELQLSQRSGLALVGNTDAGAWIYEVPKGVEVGQAVNKLIATGLISTVPEVVQGDGSAVDLAVTVKTSGQVEAANKAWKASRVKLSPELALSVATNADYCGQADDGSQAIYSVPTTADLKQVFNRFVATGHVTAVPSLLGVQDGQYLIQASVDKN